MDVLTLSLNYKIHLVYLQVGDMRHVSNHWEIKLWMFFEGRGFGRLLASHAGREGRTVDQNVIYLYILMNWKGAIWHLKLSTSRGSSESGVPMCMCARKQKANQSHSATLSSRPTPALRHPSIFL